VGRYTGIKREEELKNKVGQDFFGMFDHTERIKDIDFVVRLKQADNALDFHNDYLLWAEAKKDLSDIADMLAQLFLTIGKAKNLDKYLTPPYLGCFDCDKIAFVQYHEIHDIFYINDFNWNVKPSDRETKEFKQVSEKIRRFDESKIFIFDFEKDNKGLKEFIKENLDLCRHDTRKIRIDKGNFRNIYNRWLETVKPTIKIDWDVGRKHGIIDGDFYLADLLSSENKTDPILDNLFVLLKDNYYKTHRHNDDELDLPTYMDIKFTDGQRAHTQFWAIYERPPKEEFWDYMVERRDLLVPRDIRERKGSFFTPEKWVKLSQKYIADVFGKNWQDEYYVWDCAAGTGNLLAGLTDKFRIWASTLDQADVDVMHTLIKKSGMNLLEKHCFQFDFLNDESKKLPKGLLDVIKNTPEKLIVYINPPYVEGDARVGRGRRGVHESRIHDEYQNILGRASAELFAQFLIRIYKEFPRCKIANFATLKALSASSFGGFRQNFKAKLERLFVVPADTFENVNGDFPIGFHIWNPGKEVIFKKIKADVYDKNGEFLQKKTVFSYDDTGYISDWLEKHSEGVKGAADFVGHLASVGNDFQHQRDVYIDDVKRKRIKGGRHTMISAKNLICVSVYFAVRHSIDPTWLNDRDQFLYPNGGEEADKEFQNDCFAFTLFHNGNNISSKYGVNYWIPFTESEAGVSDNFENNFMTDFIKGMIKIEPAEEDKKNELELYDRPTCTQVGKRGPLKFSAEARAVFTAGRALWRYYHAQPKSNVNASFYDIREYFQGRNDTGRMNFKSEDETYTKLIDKLRDSLKVLAKKIEPKIYEYGFLRE
jgi:hypothetical protein